MADHPTWTQEALEMLEKVPPFVRDMAKEMIEDYAKDKNEPEITAELMKQARAKFGM